MIKQFYVMDEVFPANCWECSCLDYVNRNGYECRLHNSLTQSVMTENHAKAQKQAFCPLRPMSEVSSNHISGCGIVGEFLPKVDTSTIPSSVGMCAGRIASCAHITTADSQMMLP